MDSLYKNPHGNWELVIWRHNAMDVVLSGNADEVLEQVKIDPHILYWLEGRPAQEAPTGWIVPTGAV